MACESFESRRGSQAKIRPNRGELIVPMSIALSAIAVTTANKTDCTHNTGHMQAPARNRVSVASRHSIHFVKDAAGKRRGVGSGSGGEDFAAEDGA